jgi:hypothetical protein
VNRADRNPSSALRPSALFVYVVFVGCLGFFLATTRIGWKGSLVEDQGFRQTQTALSTYYVMQQGPKLAYETPVFGPPWTIPLEFPLYQWLVAASAAAGDAPLEQTGRFISVTFFLLTLIPAYHLLGQMKFSRENRLLILSLFLVSPFYAYWSRAFMIESTGLFLSTSYLAFAAAFLKAPTLRSGTCAVMTGTLASLVKVTTFAPFLLGVCLFACFLVWKTYQQDPCRSVLRAGAGRLLLLAAPPVICLAWWTHFADGAKELCYIGHWLTSRSLITWTFGTWEERKSLSEWHRIVARYGLIGGHLGCALLCIPGLCFGGRRLQVAAALLLALICPCVFVRLYFNHEYYAYANGMFLLAAIGMGLVVLRERTGWLRQAAHVGLVIFIGVAVCRYYQYFYPKQKNRFSLYWLEGVLQVVREETQPDDVIVVLGCDWSSEIPYYTHRRALMIPNWKLVEFFQNPQLFLKGLEGYRVGAMVVSNPTIRRINPGPVERVVEVAHLNLSCRFACGDVFSVYSSRSGDQPPARLIAASGEACQPN